MTKAPIKRATGSAKAIGAWPQWAVKMLVLAVFQAFAYALVCGCPLAAWAADEVRWQYTVPFARGSDKSGATLEPGRLFFWMPPKCQTLRGLFMMGQLGIEGELVAAPEIRQACAENALGIAYFAPHISGVFHYWEAGNTDGDRWLKALDDLARRAGHPEVRRVPWITAGHSTAGIFCRNVALFLRKCAQYRLPKTLPPGEAPVNCLAVKAEQGWLTDTDLYAPKHAPAPCARYTGDPVAAFWHFDQEMAEATARWHQHLGEHQCLETPTCALLDEGDGWSFKVSSKWLDHMPEKYGGKVANQPAGHSPTSFVFRGKPDEPATLAIGPPCAGACWRFRQ